MSPTGGRPYGRGRLGRPAKSLGQGALVYHDRFALHSVIVSAVVAGMRRIDYVRLVVSGESLTPFVGGVARRYPREYRITIATANELADEGVPVRIEVRSD